MKAKQYCDQTDNVSITDTNEHYNFYDQLDLDPSQHSDDLIAACTSRLRVFERGNVPETDARVQELIAARQIFHNPHARATYDNALGRTDIPALTVPALRHLAHTGELPDEYGIPCHTDFEDAVYSHDDGDDGETSLLALFNTAPTTTRIMATLVGLMGVLAAIAVLWSRFSDNVQPVRYNPMTGAVMYNHPLFTVHESWMMLPMGAGILIPGLIVPAFRRLMVLPVLSYGVTGLLLSMFTYKSVVVGDGDKVVTIVTSLASVALIALSLMTRVQSHGTPASVSAPGEGSDGIAQVPSGDGMVDSTSSTPGPAEAGGLGAEVHRGDSTAVGREAADSPLNRTNE
ncbi:hypothetical protein ACGE24_00610 [Corynebacterium kroppenstedtii]|uniref:hypothetical protein n=1 Tax=Corynebacterium sp. PCR 32 TaxID=3351342 RepID=UPI0030A6B2F1